MTIQPRSVTAFIGPSGCGKSTFLRTLNRMHEVIPGAYVEGQVLIDGNNLYGPGVDPVNVRRQVGMVFQRPNPFPTMSIKDNVLAGYRLNTSLGEKEFYTQVGLQDGDVVRRVNSMRMTSQRRAEYFIGEFVQNRLGAVVIDIERNGQPKKLVYLVK